MNVAQKLVECLAAEGVEYIFGIPGEENLEVIEAIAESPIRFITTRHEQGAAFMADVYGRLTGKAGVCLATLGPGATNLITGVADANSDGAPLVAITGQVSSERMQCGRQSGPVVQRLGYGSQGGNRSSIPQRELCLLYPPDHPYTEHAHRSFSMQYT